MTTPPKPISPASSPSIPGARAASRGSVATVLLVIFIDLLGFGIVLPMLPYVVGEYARPGWLSAGMDWAGVAEINRNAVVVGLIGFAFSLMSFFCSPLWGRLSDRLGRKPVLAISMLGYTVSWFMWVIAPDLTWLIVGRALAGVFAANIAAAQAYMADVYPPEQRSKGMGLVGAAFGLGFTLGPAVGSGLSELGNWIDPPAAKGEHSSLSLHLPFYVAMGLSFLAFLLAAFRLPESLPVELRGVKKPKVRRTRQLLHALGRPALGSLLVSFFTVTTGFAVLEQLFSVYDRDVLELPPTITSLVFSIIGVVIVIVQGGLIGRLTKRYGSWHLLIFGMFLMGITLTLFGAVRIIADSMALPTIPILILASVCLAFGSSLCTPSTLSLVSRATPPDEQGGTMGLTSSASALGRVLGPLMGAGVWGLFGHVAAFAAGGITVLLAIPFVIHAKSHAKLAAAAGTPGGMAH
jgi:DHA1 family tetracycline resistance protein-like MFS transporter